MQNKEDNNYIKFLYGRLETSKIIDIDKEREKYQLLKEGIELVGENVREKMKACFLNCSDESYSMCIFKTLLLCLRKLKNGASYEEIFALFNSIKITPFMIREVSNLLIHFSENGEEFKEYFANVANLSNDEKDLYFNSSYLMGKEIKNNIRR